MRAPEATGAGRQHEHNGEGRQQFGTNRQVVQAARELEQKGQASHLRSYPVGVPGLCVFPGEAGRSHHHAAAHLKNRSARAKL
jgi:hypothetical protein